MISTPKINLQEQREFSEKINATFAFIRQNFTPLFKSLLYIAGPLLLISGIYAGLFSNPSTAPAPGENPFGFLAELYASLAPLFLLSYITNTLIIAVVYSYMVLYQQEDYTSITVGQVWIVAKKNILMLLIAGLLFSIIIGIGFIFLIIPGIILAVALSFSFFIIVKENKGIGSAFSRCFKLVSGNYLSTLGLLIVTSIIYFVVVIIFNIPNAILGGASLLFGISDDGATNPTGLIKILFIISQLVYTIGSQLASIIILIAIAFQYYNLVEKKEAFGLMESINNIGTTKTGTEDEETF